jgi:hypothetical protein
VFSAWRESENPDPYLFEHVFNWVQELEEIGPERIPGVRLEAADGKYAIVAQLTNVRVDFIADDDTIVLRRISHMPPGRQDRNRLV